MGGNDDKRTPNDDKFSTNGDKLNGNGDQLQVNGDQLARNGDHLRAAEKDLPIISEHCAMRCKPYNPLDGDNR